MFNFVLKRLASAVVIVIVLTAVLFLLEHVSKVNPVHAMLGAGASQSAIKAETHKLGLDRPVTAQYFSYLDGIIHGNLGTSYRTRRPVVSDLATYLPATAELTLYSLILALFLGTILGVMSAGRRKGAGILRMVMITGSSTPPFLLALVGILFLYGHFNLLPASGRLGISNPPTGPTGLFTIDGLLNGQLGVTIDAFKYLLLPAFAVSLGPAVSIGRVLRSSLISSMESDFVRTARAKGLKESKVILRHALRNSVGPALSMTGLQAGLMFAGVVVIEDVFAWPGIGYYTAQSIPTGDFPAVAGVTLVLSVGYVVINAVVDILQALADPRISLTEKRAKKSTVISRTALSTAE